MLPSAQWYWACSGSTLTDRSGRPFRYQTSARTGKTANSIAAIASMTASAGCQTTSTGFLTPARRAEPVTDAPPAPSDCSPERGEGDAADHNAPARSQTAPVAGAQSKLKTTHTEKPTRAALSPGTCGSDRPLQAARNTTNRTQPSAASPSTPCVP